MNNATTENNSPNTGRSFCSETFQPLCRGLHQLANTQNIHRIYTVPAVRHLTPDVYNHTPDVYNHTPDAYNHTPEIKEDSSLHLTENALHLEITQGTDS